MLSLSYLFRRPNLYKTSRFLNNIPNKDTNSHVKNSTSQQTTKESTLSYKESLAKSGIRILTTKQELPFVSTKIIFEAGSRYEDHSNLGVTHAIRSNLLMSNNKNTLIDMARSIGHYGADINVTCDRDNIIIGIKSLPDHSLDILQKVNNAIMDPVYYHWELADSFDWMVPEINSIRYGNMKQFVFDELHKASFRNKLGNSLYLDPINISKLSREEMIKFHKKFFCGSRCTIVSSGCNNKTLEHIIEKELVLPYGQPVVDEKLPVYPSEVRLANDHSWSHSAIGFSSVGYKNSSLPSFLVLEALFGHYDYKYSSLQYSGRLSDITSQNDGILKASVINFTYKDNGLFCFYFSCPNDTITQTFNSVFHVINTLKDFKLSERELNYAKNKAKLKVFNDLEDPDTLLLNIGLKDNPFVNAEQLCSQIDALSLNDINNVAKGLSSQRPTMVVVGDISKVLPLDELLRK